MAKRGQTDKMTKIDDPEFAAPGIEGTKSDSPAPVIPVETGSFQSSLDGGIQSQVSEPNPAEKSVITIEDGKAVRKTFLDGKLIRTENA